MGLMMCDHCRDAFDSDTTDSIHEDIALCPRCQSGEAKGDPGVRLTMLKIHCKELIRVWRWNADNTLSVGDNTKSRYQNGLLHGVADALQTRLNHVFNMNDAREPQAEIGTGINRPAELTRGDEL